MIKHILFTFIYVLTFNNFTLAEDVHYAQMNCDVYHTKIVNNKLTESRHLVSNVINRFELGMAKIMETNLPSPFQNVKVIFTHFSTYYNETGPSSLTPFIQAYFQINRNGIKKDTKFSRTNFDIVDPVDGSRIILRKALKYDKKSLLAYQCYLTYVN